MFGTAPSDDASDGGFAKSVEMRVDIVATVGVENFGLGKRLAASALNR